MGTDGTRVALVTGAGGPRGIGFASARALGEAGCRVAVCATSDRIHERSSELAAVGIDSAGFIGDLTDPDVARTLVDDVLARFGRVDVLVNNAGMVNVSMAEEPSTRILETSDEGWVLVWR